MRLIAFYPADTESSFIPEVLEEMHESSRLGKPADDVDQMLELIQGDSPLGDYDESTTYYLLTPGLTEAQTEFLDEEMSGSDTDE